MKKQQQRVPLAIPDGEFAYDSEIARQVFFFVLDHYTNGCLSIELHGLYRSSQRGEPIKVKGKWIGPLLERRLDSCRTQHYYCPKCHYSVALGDCSFHPVNIMEYIRVGRYCFPLDCHCCNGFMEPKEPKP